MAVPITFKMNSIIENTVLGLFTVSICSSDCDNANKWVPLVSIGTIHIKPRQTLKEKIANAIAYCVNMQNSYQTVY